MGRRVLKFDGAFGPEGCGGALRAQIIKKSARALRHFDRSRAEWRNLPPLMVHEAWGREISRLRVSSKRFPSATYRYAAPLEMTMLASSIQSFQKWTNDKNAAPPLVISTEAKRSGEISPSDGTGGITAGDLSTQSIIKALSICPHTDTQPRSR